MKIREQETKKPTLEAVKKIAQKVYHKHTLNHVHGQYPSHFEKWMNNRYEEFNKALANEWEPVDLIYCETDNGNRSLDIVVRFFDLQKFTFEIDLKWNP